MRKLTGFTLMELMIVIAIIMVLSGAIVARIGTGSEKAKIAKAKAEIEEIASACRAFYADVGYWPVVGNPDVGDFGLINKDNIGYLIYENGSSTLALIDYAKSKWKGPYLDAATWPKDPWGSRYYWVTDPSVSPRVVCVYCAGPDRSFNIYNANAGDDLKVLVHIFSK